MKAIEILSSRSLRFRLALFLAILAAWGWLGAFAHSRGGAMSGNRPVASSSVYQEPLPVLYSDGGARDLKR